MSSIYTINSNQIYLYSTFHNTYSFKALQQVHFRNV